MKFAALFLFLLFAFPVKADSRDISLPSPKKSGGKPVMQALKDRNSNRNFANASPETEKFVKTQLSDQQLSDLLWAAFGINRTEEGKRTAPTPKNAQNFDIYVFLDKGVYKYDALSQKLLFKKEGNFHAHTGWQDFVLKAPVNLVFVALNLDKSQTDGEKVYSAYISAGAIMENVYLYASSENLATVARVSFDEGLISGFLELPKDQKPLLTQSVGIPCPGVKAQKK